MAPIFFLNRDNFPPIFRKCLDLFCNSQKSAVAIQKNDGVGPAISFEKVFSSHFPILSWPEKIQNFEPGWGRTII
jgi:hypothetical protein